MREPTGLKRLLEASLGVRAIVDKRRSVYLYENVRIHLDRVRGLGNFIELEAVMPDGIEDEEGTSILHRLMQIFSLSADDLIGSSYCDLMNRDGR